jgi:hypothetical protein
MWHDAHLSYISATSECIRLYVVHSWPSCPLNPLALSEVSTRAPPLEWQLDTRTHTPLTRIPSIPHARAHVAGEPSAILVPSVGRGGARDLSGAQHLRSSRPRSVPSNGGGGWPWWRCVVSRTRACVREQGRYCWATRRERLRTTGRPGSSWPTYSTPPTTRWPRLCSVRVRCVAPRRRPG